MSAPSLLHRRAERFARLVDDPDTGAGGPADPRLEELLTLVGGLREMADSAPSPRPAVVADLRARLLAEAETALVPTADQLLLTRRHAGRRPGRRSSRLVAATAALVMAGGTAGVAVAAEHSLPGAPLYVVKQGVEGAQRTLALGRADRGKVELSQARTRLEEVRSLAERGDLPRAGDTLGRFRSSADAGADQLFTAYQSDADPADITAVRSFAADAMARLTDLSAAVPAGDRTDYADAAAALEALDQEARVLCPQCGSAAALSAPTALAAPPAGVGEVPLAAQVAAAQALAANLPLPAATAGGAGAGVTTPGDNPSTVPGTVPGSLPTSAAGSTGAGKPVQQVGGAVTSALPSGALPSAVSSALTSVTTAVDGVVDTATGTVGGAATSVGGVLGGLTSPAP